MIKKIVIRDVASYDHEGVTFDNLAKVNFVYGGNGTGKTTLSRYLKNIKERIVFPNAEQYRYKQCQIELDDNINGWHILVYNRDFRDESLKEDMPGIFTLGEDYVNYEHKLVHEYIPMVEAMQRDELDDEEKLKLLQLNGELHAKFDIINFYRPSIDYINGMLKNVGFNNFHIQMSPTEEECYQIQREDGSFVFESLSEGETTFISFLYFMQVVNNYIKDSDPRKKTFVVIDDPISSLDADAIGVVASLIRQLMEQIFAGRGNDKQMMVMTHNLEFFKKVAPYQRRHATHHWRLIKKGDVSRAIDCGEEKPVRSGYEQLWAELREECGMIDSTRIQNLMRNIIETYFMVFGGLSKRQIIKLSSETHKERAEIEDFFKWIDEGSHGVEEDLYAEDPQQRNERYLEMFHQLFSKLGHEAHYRMMMREE